MRVILSAALLIAAAPAAAQSIEMKSVCVVAHGLSKHAVARNWPVAGADWQERNWGGGICARFSVPRFAFIKSIGVTAGAYRNSLSSNAFPSRRWEWTKYVAVDADLLGWRRGRWYAEAGPMAGVFFGYRVAPIAPMIGVRGAIGYSLTDRIGVSLVGTAFPTFGKSRAVGALSIRFSYSLQPR